MLIHFEKVQQRRHNDNAAANPDHSGENAGRNADSKTSSQVSNLHAFSPFAAARAARKE
jgi:hypothetical protein